MGERGRGSSTKVTEIILHLVLSIIEKDLSAPKSFITGGTASLGLKVLIPIKMDKPLGGVLLYALMSCLNTLMKVKDLLQHFF